jgi:hypothetical protein
MDTLIYLGNEIIKKAKLMQRPIEEYGHVLSVVTIDGVGLTTGFIGFLVSYKQLQCTHTVDLHTRLHFTDFSGNGSSDCVPLHCLG